MERTLYLITFMLFIISKMPAQTSYKEKIYNCYINNKMNDWKTIIDKMNEKENKSDEYTLELLNYQYGYIGWCLGNDKEDDAEKYLDLAIENTEYLENKNYQLSMINGYKSALWGFKIGLAFYKAPFLGPESIDFAKKSIELDKNNYFGYLQSGNIEFYMPAAFGGSKTLALKYYKKAETLLTDKKENWNYISLLIVIAQAYTKTGHYEKAKKYCEKILSIEPDFDWIKNILLPEINRKIKNQ